MTGRSGPGMVEKYWLLLSKEGRKEGGLITRTFLKHVGTTIGISSDISLSLYIQYISLTSSLSFVSRRRNSGLCKAPGRSSRTRHDSWSV